MMYPESRMILAAMKTDAVRKGLPDQAGWSPRALIKAYSRIEEDHIFDEALQYLVSTGILSAKPSQQYGELYTFSLRGRHRLIAFVNSTLGVILTSIVFPAAVALVTVLLDHWLNP